MHFFAKQGAAPDTQFSTMDIQATYAMVGAGLGYSISNNLNCNYNDPLVHHMKLEPGRLIEIDLAYDTEQPPASAEFLSFIRRNTPVS